MLFLISKMNVHVKFKGGTAYLHQDIGGHQLKLLSYPNLLTPSAKVIQPRYQISTNQSSLSN